MSKDKASKASPPGRRSESALSPPKGARDGAGDPASRGGAPTARPAGRGGTPRGIDVLISEQELEARVAAMGADITRDYAGEPLVVIGVLKGSFIFLADLVRAIDLPITIDFIGISSYQGTRSTGAVQITSDLTRPIEGKDVLLVEDIVDTGLTMRYLLDNLGTRQPASLRICGLLEKPSRAR